MRDARKAVLREREACAQLVEQMAKGVRANGCAVAQIGAGYLAEGRLRQLGAGYLEEAADAIRMQTKLEEALTVSNTKAENEIIMRYRKRKAKYVKKAKKRKRA